MSVGGPARALAASYSAFHRIRSAIALVITWRYTGTVDVERVPDPPREPRQAVLTPDVGRQPLRLGHVDAGRLQHLPHHLGPVGRGAP